ncbi:MAG: flagellar basal body P-ring protein FlgI, partial [Bryobacteraceae bacterium]
QTVNHPTTGRSPEAAIVERAPPSIASSAHMKLQLHEADFTTAARVVDLLNKHFSPGASPIAHAESPALIDVDLPPTYSNRAIAFVAELEDLSVDADQRAKVVVNERTGTIVIGKDVRISPVSIMHGALTVEVRTKFDVSQPASFSQGKTAVVPQTNVTAKEDKAQNIVLDKGATIEDLVRALQAIGSTPRDVISILDNLRAAGALDAEIEVI